MPHILIAGELHPAGIELLETRNDCSLDYIRETSVKKFLPFLKKADALIIRTQPLTHDNIKDCEKLKVVSRHGVGFDQIDLQALRKRNIPLTIVGDVNSNSVSEHTLMLILAVFKRILFAEEAVRNLDWNYRDKYEAIELSGKNLLIVGYGRIGQRVAELALGFGMNIRVFDPFISRQIVSTEVVYHDCLEDAISDADCISLHLPQLNTPILSKEVARYFKRGVIIINTSRGGLIEPKILIEGIDSGLIGGLGLDVFEEEPPEKKMVFANYKQVIVTPHQAGLSAEAAKRMSLKSVQNVLDFFDGKLDQSLVVNGVVI